MTRPQHLLGHRPLSEIITDVPPTGAIGVELVHAADVGVCATFQRDGGSTFAARALTGIHQEATVTSRVRHQANFPDAPGTSISCFDSATRWGLGLNSQFGVPTSSQDDLATLQFGAAWSGSARWPRGAEDVSVHALHEQIR